MTAKLLIIMDLRGHWSLVTFAIHLILHYSASQTYFLKGQKLYIYFQDRMLLPLQGVNAMTIRNPGCRFACPGLCAVALSGRAY